MQESWMQLQCPGCGEQWEEKVADMPTPSAEFDCDHCGETHPTREFAKTTRDLEVLREFH